MDTLALRAKILPAQEDGVSERESSESCCSSPRLDEDNTATKRRLRKLRSCVSSLPTLSLRIGGPEKKLLGPTVIPRSTKKIFTSSWLSMVANAKRQGGSDVPTINVTPGSHGREATAGVKLNQQHVLSRDMGGEIALRKRALLKRNNSDNDYLTMKHNARHIPSTCTMRDSSLDNSLLSVDAPMQVRRRSRTMDSFDCSMTSKSLFHLNRLRSNSSTSTTVTSSPAGTGTGHTISPHVISTPRDSLSSSSVGTFNNVNHSGSVRTKRNGSIVNVLTNFVSVKSSTPIPKPLPVLIYLDNMSPPPAADSSLSEDEYIGSLSVYGRYVAAILAEDGNEFKQKCLERYISTEFDFFGEPLDVSLRKLLLLLSLPKESQQIERMISCFATAYYNQNKHDSLWGGCDDISRMAFSLLMLHTDHFNSNNKNKMTKVEFIKLLHDDQKHIPKEIADYLYDAITVREFPHVLLPPFMTMDDEDSQSAALCSELCCNFSPMAIIKSRYLLFRTELWVQAKGKSNSISFLNNHVSSASSVKHMLTDDIDIYYHIVNDSVSSATLAADMEKHGYTIPPVPSMPGVLQLSHKNLATFTEVKGGYLKASKEMLRNFVDIPLGAADTNLFYADSEYRYMKIIQIGKLEDMMVKKFPLVGKTTWKMHHFILTTFALFIFDGNYQLDSSVETDEVTNTTNIVIPFPPTSHVVKVLDCNGLYATAFPGAHKPSVAHEDEILHVHRNGQEYRFHCASSSERQMWLEAINMVAAISNCYIIIPSIPNSVGPIQKWSLHEKWEKLNSSLQEMRSKLDTVVKILECCQTLAPITGRCRSQLLKYVEQNLTRMDWLTYEIARKQAYLEILRSIMKVSQEAPVPDDQTSIEDSFLFKESHIKGHECARISSWHK
ncbi:ABR102Wp [Eremothecium gossypii ATCC 10895]|uniref:ABR102Wp n=1 Tax=Eremothecium gossypii (strain ATCC 10895 / CBS 109.51 / FGSC 9923 / NRRL Y-1056) TaxID=284811 RepID=Q75DC4_EREGS|nr:ABR102Wp [Eremothecium gossypii ATCC 10895]AAS50873.2 ABR102Wp [Eremothecium gossypii ATCC 10895]AEY95162.1 FABR102Wp [Eremothecium gossypii FDAG1]